MPTRSAPRPAASLAVLTTLTVLVVGAVLTGVLAGLAGRTMPGAATASSAPTAASPPSSASTAAGAAGSAAGSPTALPDVPVRDADLAAAAPAATPAPIGLALPSLGVDVPVDPVGVQEDGQMEIPPLAERAGWYRFGPAPGASEGTAVVAAHVDSVASAGLGPFARLGELRPGDLVEVTLDDGTTTTYAVRDVGAQPKPDVVWAEVFRRDGAPRLVLVTCGGSFDRAARSYTDNVIVTADPVGA